MTNPRTTRNLSPVTRSKISATQTKRHQERGEAKRIEISQKQSDSLKKYWQTIPQAPDINIDNEENINRDTTTI